MHSIIRIKKHKSIASLKSRENHTYRKRPTPNADPTKQHLNKLLFGQMQYADGLEKNLADYKNSGLKIRKDAVLAVEFLLTASPEFFDAGLKNERKQRLDKWCEAQIEFLKKEHGAQNILCMYLHLDEKTPHIEAYVVPKDAKGKLNCKSFYGPKNALNELQTRYATHNQSFGLTRGSKGSRATHQQVQKFYHQIKQPANMTTESLQEVVKLDAPSIKSMLNPEIYLKEQEAKIVKKVASLFVSVVYENKLIQQARKILTEWQRAMATAKKEMNKLENEKVALQDKLHRQDKAIKQLQQLELDNKDLQKNLSNALIHNQLLKAKNAEPKLKM
jgi:hypothetical protein